jgi:hypothetical protein
MGATKLLDEAVRWTPVEGLPELPLGALDFTYTASVNRLTVSAYFRDVSHFFPQFEPPIDGLILDFENVEAFKAYEEFTDPLFAKQTDVPRLADEIPYGGTWGFIEIMRSSWLDRLADRNLRGDRSASHWVVKSEDMVLHVSVRPSLAPTFRSWIFQPAAE